MRLKCILKPDFQVTLCTHWIVNIPGTLCNLRQLIRKSILCGMTVIFETNITTISGNKNGLADFKFWTVPNTWILCLRNKAACHRWLPKRPRSGHIHYFIIVLWTIHCVFLRPLTCRCRCIIISLKVLFGFVILAWCLTYNTGCLI